jgi:phosphoserine phosphatase RsbU/P
MRASPTQRRDVGDGARHRSRAVDLSTHSVLVADADVSTRYVLAYALREAGLQTVQADNGPRALQFAEHVSAVLLDVELPGLDGLEICRILRRTPRTRTMPVIHMSWAAGPEHELAANDAGANAFLRRPVTSQALTQTVIELLSAKR